MTSAIKVTTGIAAPAPIVFSMALNMDVHARSLARSRETAVTSSGRAVLGLGDEVTFTARHWRLRWRMTSRVTELQAPVRFVDEQVRGPFARMRHEHVFFSEGGGTRMVDHVEFAAPLGVVGRLVDTLLLRRYLTALIVERAAYLKAAAERRSRDEGGGAS